MVSVFSRSLIGASLLFLGSACSLDENAPQHDGSLDNAAREIAVEVVRSAGIGEVWTSATRPLEIGIYIANDRLRRRCESKYESEARAFARLVTSSSFPVFYRRSNRPARIALLIASTEELATYNAQWDQAFGTEKMTTLYSVRDRVTGDEVNVVGRSSTIEVAVALILTTPERLPLFDDCDLRVNTYLSIMLSQYKAYVAGWTATDRAGFKAEELKLRALGIIAEAVHGQLAAGRPATKEAVLARLGIL